MAEGKELYPPVDELADEDDELEGCTCADPSHDHDHDHTHVDEQYPETVADDDLEGFLVPEDGG